MKKSDSVHLDYYRIFYYVAKYQSISTAANMLFLTQPTVSRTIRNLEEELGATLFVRSKKGVSLTAEGQILYPHIAEAIAYISKASQNLDSYLSGDTGSISFVSTEIAFYLCLSPFLAHYKGKNPNVSMIIRNEHSLEGIELLKKGLVDFALLTGPIKTGDETIKLTPIRNFQDQMVGSEKYRFLARSMQTMETLSKYQLISVKLNMVNELYLKQIRPFFLNIQSGAHSIINVENYHQAKSLIMRGVGIGAIPEDLIKYELNDGLLYRIPMGEKIPRRGIYLATIPVKPISPLSKNFIKDIMNFFNGYS